MKGKKNITAASPAKGPTTTQKLGTSSSKPRSDDSDNELSVEGFWRRYQSMTDSHTKIIDLFILYLVTIIGFQVFYRLIVGDDFPRNAFVAGTFCPLGVIVLLVILRGRGRDLRQLTEFFLACLVLFITAINFAG